MLTDVERDREGAHDGALEAQPEQQAPIRMPTARRQERPTPRGVNRDIVFDDARKVEDIASPARVDVQRNSQTVFGIAIENSRRVAGQRITGEFLEALLETFGRESGQVFENG